MQKLGWLIASALTLLITGCTSCHEEVGPQGLVDVNVERGDVAGRNYYTYKSHELHPGFVRRYDYHPVVYHRFRERDSWSQ